MNAQQLLNETPTTNFDFGVFWRKTRESLSPIKISRGDKFVARTGNKIPAIGSIWLSESNLSQSYQSLMPRTLNYTKLNESRRNLEWQQAEKELGLIQL